MSDIELIDSHCHLIFENFEKDLQDVVQRLRSKGVKKLVHACCELKEIPKLKKISHKFNEIYYSVGLHPLEAKKWEQSSKSLLRRSAQEDKRVVAIGELGLDFFKNQNKAKKKLKWKSKTNLKNGLKNTFDWYLNNKNYYTSLKKKDIRKRLGSIR